MLEISEQHGMLGQERSELIINKQTKRQVGERPAQLVQLLHKRACQLLLVQSSSLKSLIGTPSKLYQIAKSSIPRNEVRRRLEPLGETERQ